MSYKLETKTEGELKELWDGANSNIQYYQEKINDNKTKRGKYTSAKRYLSGAKTSMHDAVTEMKDVISNYKADYNGSTTAEEWVESATVWKNTISSAWIQAGYQYDAINDRISELADEYEDLYRIKQANVEMKQDIKSELARRNISTSWCS